MLTKYGTLLNIGLLNGDIKNSIMTQEEKQLLLKDLCARLPYNPWVHYEDTNYLVTGYGHGRVSLLPSIFSSVTGPCPLIDEIKPYLRPMPSMTEEEENEYMAINSYEGLFPCNEDALDYVLEHHLDFRGLIEKGLALEAPPEMYDKEESEKGSEVPIPKTVDEAVKTLAKIVSKEDRDYLLENGAISVHHSLGRWIRNEWGLWTDSELKNELKKKGFEHPDDMSNYIIEEFIKYWNNKI